MRDNLQLDRDGANRSRGEVAIRCCMARARLDTSVANNARRYTWQRHKTTIRQPYCKIQVVNTF